MDGMIVANENSKKENPVLSINNLCKSFGSRRILDNISFDVEKGEILGLLGPNGSGKTTTIKLALGLLKIDAGNVTICGYDVKNDFEKAIRNVGAIVENPEMYKNLTGRQNLMQYYRMYDDINLETLEWAIKSVGLSNRIDEKISKYSLGMRQRLGIAQALLHSPKLLILDEPTNGLDPEGIKQFRDFLIYLAHEKGISVLISSHLLAELDSLCDRVAVINSGRIVGIQTMEQIRHFGEEKASYKLIVDNSEITSSVFEEKGIEYQIIAENTFKVSVDEDVAETIMTMLFERGVRVKAFAPIEKTLEDAFIQMVTESGGSKI
ncbi:MAG: ABC transporter ATP-binding protein [Clostridia bacterium]|nr:ABC transporter ATP-binding protein [Clostridia bacterium]